MNTIDKIRNWVEKQKAFLPTVGYSTQVAEEYIPVQNFMNYLLSFLDTLQEPIKVYRVENETEQKGLWRKFDGTWEPLFDMLTDGQCRNMPMDDNDIYHAEGLRWFASAPSTKTLQKWFSKKDLEELTAAGFTITEFTISRYKVLSEFEYIFPRECIITTRHLSVRDIYPDTLQEPEVDWERQFSHEYAVYHLPDFVIESLENGMEWIDFIYHTARHFYKLGKNAK